MQLRSVRLKSNSYIALLIYCQFSVQRGGARIHPWSYRKAHCTDIAVNPLVFHPELMLLQIFT